MKVLILGGDGYLGWPTTMHFANEGHDVYAIDNLSKRKILAYLRSLRKIKINILFSKFIKKIKNIC